MQLLGTPPKTARPAPQPCLVREIDPIQYNGSSGRSPIPLQRRIRRLLDVKPVWESGTERAHTQHLGSMSLMIRRLNPLRARAAALILVAPMSGGTLFAYSVLTHEENC